MTLRTWREADGSWSASAEYRGIYLVVRGRPTRHESSWHACASAYWWARK